MFSITAQFKTPEILSIQKRKTKCVTLLYMHEIKPYEPCCYGGEGNPRQDGLMWPRTKKIAKYCIY